MINIDYKHSASLSFEAKMIQSIMHLIGMKKKMEKKLKSNSFEKKPTTLSKSLTRNFSIQEKVHNGRAVWTISPKDTNTNVVILFLHGGAYMANISKLHWGLVEQLITSLHATVVVPDYPLAPEARCEETYEFVHLLYTQMIATYATKRIVLIGDSAGGGLAFGYVQQLRNKNIQQPHQIILFSPWLDVTMTNPNIKLIYKDEPILSIDGLKNAGQQYAGNIDVLDYRVSPIYGEFNALCKISIFTGTNDILHADTQKCKELMKMQQIQLNYFEYPHMFHDWVIMSRLKESRDVINKVYNLVYDAD